MIAESVSLILTAENPQYTKYWDVSVHFTDRHSRQKCTDNLLYIQLRILSIQINWLMSTFCKVLNRISLQIILWWCFIWFFRMWELQFMHLIFLNSLNERCHIICLFSLISITVLWANVTEQRYRFRCLFLSMCVLKMSFKVTALSLSDDRQPNIKQRNCCRS
jgi:hypothetical protein